ncbi:MAG: isoprenyl transferase [Bacteroidales bacterium]|jgi:undecaprenyl diphosphate synthase|nr:isoprenyl transferase [Bacteroidales bacterium]
MEKLLDQIRNFDQSRLPRHIAIIMDGNGRWAQQQGKPRVFGHQQGVNAVRNAIEGSGEAGVKYLTLFAFSTENWNRPAEEVNALTGLLVKAIHAELENLQKNQVRLKVIGNLKALPNECYHELLKAIDQTKENTGLTVILALSYSSRWEITEMAKNIGEKVKKNTLNPQEIDDQTVIDNLTTFDIPDPDILIRTGGEFRISNFLLYQIAYSELFFSSIMWPDFSKKTLWQIILDYFSRQRRFGKTSEQVSCSE